MKAVYDFSAIAWVREWRMPAKLRFVIKYCKHIQKAEMKFRTADREAVITFAWTAGHAKLPNNCLIFRLPFVIINKNLEKNNICVALNREKPPDKRKFYLPKPICPYWSQHY